MKFTAPTNAAPATLIPIPALSDNYIWMVQKNGHALVVDPGEAAPVLNRLGRDLALDAILITHHHNDHTGGVRALQQRTGARVYGPRHESLPVCDQPLSEGDTVELRALGLQFQVLDIPGHTAGHIAYVGLIDPDQPVIFCGDTLFSVGCGRLFEGTPAQMIASLGKIKNLPAETWICCAHEYTAANIRWALQVDPENEALQARDREVAKLRMQGQPTLPSRVGQELRTNPFLRTSHPDVHAAAEHVAGSTLTSPEAVFACLRHWKNEFK